MHSRDPNSLDVAEGYKTLLSKAETKNPILKGKIALWEPDEDHGIVLIITYDASHYYMSPVILGLRML
ncbi:MAG: hypothetical protein V4506_17165 [Bacteroidota bacterium]